MAKFTKWFQISVILILFFKIVLYGVAESSDTLLFREDELQQQKIKRIDPESNRLFKENDNKKWKKSNRFRKKDKISLYSKMISGEFGLGNKHNFPRKTRSITSKNVSSPQSEQLCATLEVQLPCTCYYPDYPNGTQFELDTDEITNNASSIDGTGPENCEDLRSNGYNLAGFYIVRFKPKRVKAVYCGFNQTSGNFNQKIAKSSLKQNMDAKISQILQFCSNGSGSQPCTFLYPDYPDMPLVNVKKNKTTNTSITSQDNYALGPTSCDDLKLIGHKFAGFYLLRRNALKVKIVFCDFHQNIENIQQMRRKRRAILKKNETVLPKNSLGVCKSVGSQPCSCYLSNFTETLQFELSNDEITRNAVHNNGPSTCEELHQMGHNLDGFYFLRFNIRTIRTAFCKLNEVKTKNKNEEMRKETTINKKNRQNCDPNNHTGKREDYGCSLNYKNENNHVLQNVSRSQLCAFGYGALPCTCYYPDHENVTLFQLETNEITKNFTSVNGTGPESCEDLQSMRYNLPGYYMVRFKTNRVKAIYCGFNQANEDLGNTSKVVNKSFFKQLRDPESSGTIRLCNGIGNHSCTFLYPDYPDVPLVHLKRNKTARNNESCESCILGPTSCYDLKRLGHEFKGFYIVRQNALKVKILYCDFNQTVSSFGELKRVEKSDFQKNVTTLSKNTARVCRDSGSKPCSCNYPNFRHILQFEMSDDEITRNAMDENGVASTCEELKKEGYRLDGFYMLRLNAKSIKISFCKLNGTEQKIKKGKKNKNKSSKIETTTLTLSEILTTESTITTKKKKQTKVSTMEPPSTLLVTEMITAPSTMTSSSLGPITTEKKRPKCDQFNQVFHLKNEEQGYCLERKAGNSFSFSECDNFPLEQQWFKFKIPNINVGFYISSGNGCLAVASPSWLSNLSLLLSGLTKEPEVSLQPYNEKSLNQQWIFDKETQQLKNVINSLCLVAYSTSSRSTSMIGMQTCLNEPNNLQKWSFVRVRDDNNVTVCIKG